jgi:DNA ligase 1
MKAFANLIDRLVYTRSRNAKLALIADYLCTAPDPDRGWAMAALTEVLDFRAVKAAMARALLATRVDEELARLSRQFVGETAETIALLWPDGPDHTHPPTLSEAVDALSGATRATGASVLTSLLDRLDSDGRYALMKLALGGLRLGVSARLARQAFARAFNVSIDDVEELWHAVPPPFAALFDWAEGRSPRPDLAATPFFRPFMLAHPLAVGEELDLAEFAVEWKWDGIRVQIVRAGGTTRLFSRGGEDISAAFPEITDAMPLDCAVDGELLVRGNTQGGDAASFNALQQRLGRKMVSAKMQAELPAFVRLYDLLGVGRDDLRPFSWAQRRARLEALMDELPADRFDLSGLVQASDFEALAALRDGARDAAIEGMMLKRRDAPYSGGRKVGQWYKWKRDPLTADCVMMYAQRGNGRRASFYSDYTFGCWSDSGDLLPVGKAYSGFTDEELKMLDRFVRQHTVQRFGSVREVEKTLVLEVAFDSIHRSKRHKSGLAMRFPRIARIRTDKPAAEADRIAALQVMVSD